MVRLLHSKMLAGSILWWGEPFCEEFACPLPAESNIQSVSMTSCTDKVAVKLLPAASQKRMGPTHRTQTQSLCMCDQ